MKQVELTKAGLEKLQQELEQLKEQQKPEALERLEKARGMGDLSENSEYTAAKEELAFVTERIQEIEEILKHAKVVELHTNGQEVSLGSHVTVETNGQKDAFDIVGEFESDPGQKKLSNMSPLGKALVGKKIGTVIEVETPSGKVTYKILEIK